MLAKPVWSCNVYGAYEHDWLDCPECVEEYERYLEEPEEFKESDEEFDEVD